MNENTETIHQAAKILKTAREAISSLLQSHGLSSLADITNSQVLDIEKRFYGLAGLPTGKTINVTTEFKPIRKILGITVSRTPILEKDLEPTLTEKDLLLNRIKDFYAGIPEMNNDKVLQVLHEPKGESILRGAAKAAGVAGWREDSLDINFIDSIKAAIESKKQLENVESLADTGAKSLASESGVETKSEPEIESHAEKKVKAKQLKEEGKTYKQIADELNIPPGTVSGLLK